MQFMKSIDDEWKGTEGEGESELKERVIKMETNKRKWIDGLKKIITLLKKT